MIKNNEQALFALFDLYMFNRKAEMDTASLREQIDLLRDELQRIKVCPNVSSEAKGICDRGIEAANKALGAA